MRRASARFWIGRLIKAMRIKQLVLLFLGFACVGIGLFRGETIEVMRRAIVVCLECIGLG